MPATVTAALLAAGINNHMHVFNILIDEYAIPRDALEEVINKLLRPLIIRGARDFVEVLLNLALRRRLTVDTNTYRKIIDALFKRYSMMGDEISDEKESNLRAIKRIIADYITRRNYIRALDRIVSGSPSETIIRDTRQYYTLPRFGPELIPMLPPEILAYIMSYALSRYKLEK